MTTSPGTIDLQAERPLGPLSTAFRWPGNAVAWLARDKARVWLRRKAVATWMNILIIAAAGVAAATAGLLAENHWRTRRPGVSRHSSSSRSGACHSCPGGFTCGSSGCGQRPSGTSTSSACTGLAGTCRRTCRSPRWHLSFMTRGSRGNDPGSRATAFTTRSSRHITAATFPGPR